MKRFILFSVILPTMLLMNGLVFAQDTTLAVTAAGNVGIGTTSPLERLHVEGSIYLNSAVGSLRIRHSGTREGWYVSTIGGGQNLTFVSDPAGGGGINRVTFAQGGNVGIGTTNPSQKLDVVGNIAVSGTVDGVDVSGFKVDYDNHRSNYFQFGNLNFGSVTVSSTPTRLNTTSGTHSFTKSHNDTRIEVYVNSRFGVGTISGANGVRFQVRVDNNTPTYDNQGSILTSNTSEFLPLYAVFENLAAGSHTVSIWAQAAPSGTASSVLVDPGGWGGKIIVKESR